MSNRGRSATIIPIIIMLAIQSALNDEKPARGLMQNGGVWKSTDTNNQTRVDEQEKMTQPPINFLVQASHVIKKGR
jgi:hypothetical protein